MAKSKNSPDPKQLGASLDDIQRIVGLVSEFIDKGWALLFLRRNGEIDLVVTAGQAHEFDRRIAELLPAMSHDEVQSAVLEVECAVAASARKQQREDAANLFVYMSPIFTRPIAPEDAEYKVILQKLLIVEPLVTTALKYRWRRLQTANIATVDEVDFEVIEFREDRVIGDKIQSPFIRVRLHHSLPVETVMPFVLSGRVQVARRPPFELECGLLDLDLLLERLRDARHVLAKRLEAGEVTNG